MSERLAELQPLKGRHRMYKYYGEKTGLRFKSFLDDYKIITNPAVLAKEGPQHLGHEHLIFSNCVANIGDGVLLLEITKLKGRPDRAKVEQLIEDDARPRASGRGDERVARSLTEPRATCIGISRTSSSTTCARSERAGWSEPR